MASSNFDRAFAALKAKYRTPGEVMRKLGLDEALLTEGADMTVCEKIAEILKQSGGEGLSGGEVEDLLGMLQAAARDPSEFSEVVEDFADGAGQVVDRRHRADDRRRADDRHRADDRRHIGDRHRADDRHGRRAEDDPPPEFPGRPEVGGTMTALRDEMDRREREAAADRHHRGRDARRGIRAMDQRIAMDAAPKPSGRDFATFYPGSANIGVSGVARAVKFGY